MTAVSSDDPNNKHERVLNIYNLAHRKSQPMGLLAARGGSTIHTYIRCNEDPNHWMGLNSSFAAVWHQAAAAGRFRWLYIHKYQGIVFNFEHVFFDLLFCVAQKQIFSANL